MSANTSQAFCQGILGCLSPPSKAQLRSGCQNSAVKPTHDARVWLVSSSACMELLFAFNFPSPILAFLAPLGLDASGI